MNEEDTITNQYDKDTGIMVDSNVLPIVFCTYPTTVAVVPLVTIFEFAAAFAGVGCKVTSALLIILR